jgi:hypothetical protein
MLAFQTVAQQFVHDAETLTLKLSCRRCLRLIERAFAFVVSAAQDARFVWWRLSPAVMQIKVVTHVSPGKIAATVS